MSNRQQQQTPTTTHACAHNWHYYALRTRSPSTQADVIRTHAHTREMDGCKQHDEGSANRLGSPLLAITRDLATRDPSSAHASVHELMCCAVVQCCSLRAPQNGIASKRTAECAEATFNVLHSLNATGSLSRSRTPDWRVTRTRCVHVPANRWLNNETWCAASERLSLIHI